VPQHPISGKVGRQATTLQPKGTDPKQTSVRMDNSNPQGRGNSRGNHRGRGGRGKGQRPNNKPGSKPQSTGPKGAIEALQDHTYIVGDARQADKFNKTTA
jgi:hypothetical protein